MSMNKCGEKERMVKLFVIKVLRLIECQTEQKENARKSTKHTKRHPTNTHKQNTPERYFAS